MLQAAPWSFILPGTGKVRMASQKKRGSEARGCSFRNIEGKVVDCLCESVYHFSYLCGHLFAWCPGQVLAGDLAQPVAAAHEGLLQFDDAKRAVLCCVCGRGVLGLLRCDS